MISTFEVKYKIILQEEIFVDFVISTSTQATNCFLVKYPTTVYYMVSMTAQLHVTHLGDSYP